MPDTNIGYIEMKKLIFGLFTVFAIATTVTVYANKSNQTAKHHHHDETCKMTMQGKRCNGSVGCSCSGFAPITNGKVWEEAYCRRCGHHRGVHK